jgi:hypothetical protein
MIGYPKYIGSKQDYLNLLKIPQHRERALADLQKLYKHDDTLILTTTTLKDSKNPEGEWNVELLPNPSPLWKQKGFTSRKALATIITTNGGKLS